MTKLKRIKTKKSHPCINHPNINETKECERCHQYFCSNCYLEDWHETFFGQFLARKREVVKTIYCKPCQKRVVRIRMIAYLGLLTLFTLPIVIWVLMAFIN